MATLMFVDDDTLALQLMGKISLLLGHEAILVNSALSALPLAIEKQPDVILTDLNMQGLDGIDFIHRLKAQPETEQIPVIILTASESLFSRRKVENAGADAFLSKPIGMDELSAAIDRFIS